MDSKTNNKTGALIFSMRNRNLHVSRCCIYEAEDVIAQFYNADMLTPASPAALDGLVTRGMRRILSMKVPLIDGRIRVKQDYDVFFYFCRNPAELGFVDLIEDLDRCRVSICLIDESWPTAQLSPNHIRILQRFDFVFSIIESGIGMLRNNTGKPCYHLPFGIDALRFCPHPQPARHINVYNMGRRLPELHQELIDLSRQNSFFYYVHDTVSDYQVMDHREHRRQLSEAIKRSQYFVTYPGKFDQPQVTGGFDEVPVRLFEGAAAGTIMIGKIPDCETFRNYFDWQDAVLSVNGSVSELINELETDPSRQARIRRENVINSLERHDWVYRWRAILDIAGVGSTPAMIQRSIDLQALANGVFADHAAAL